MLATAWPRTRTPLQRVSAARRERGDGARRPTAPAPRVGSRERGPGTRPGRRAHVAAPEARPPRSPRSTLAGMALAIGCERAEPPAPAAKAAAAPPSFVGSAKCAGCHPKETEAYRASDHARAIQPATDHTVLGNFDEGRISHRGVTSTFFRRDGNSSSAPTGRTASSASSRSPTLSASIPSSSTSSRSPGVGSRPSAWHGTRGPAQGGQRWFHLYPDEALRSPSLLHWTGREQTWNFQCAECHSTDLRKRYDLAANTYATAWAELRCPARNAMDLARPTSPGRRRARPEPARAGQRQRPRPAPQAGRRRVDHQGQPARHRRVDGARPVLGRTGRLCPLSCAAAADRRPYPYGKPFLDTHVPALLEPHLYHADGQVLGEVYEWGSFVQSRMQHAGVTCSDCHEPHRTTLRRRGTPSAPSATSPRSSTRQPTITIDPRRRGALRSCHMPARTHMVVDPVATTASGCRAPTSRSPSGRRTPARAVTRTDGLVGRRPGRGVGRRGPRHRGFRPDTGGRAAGTPGGGAGLGRARDRPDQPGIVGATALTHLPECRGRRSARSGGGAPRSRCPGPDGGAPCRGGVAARSAWAARRAPAQGSRAGGAARCRPGPRGKSPRRPGGGSAERFRPAVAELVKSEQVNADRPRPT